MRIFSHTCSNTEIVCAMDAGHLLVGVDGDSDYPPDIVDALPKPGRDLDLDTAAVLALKPDLVLTSLTVPGHERIVSELQGYGLRTLTLDPQSLEDVFDNVLQIAEAIGLPERGHELVAHMRRRMPRVERRGDRPRIAVEWWPKPVIVPARRSWITDMIELAGGVNPWGDVDAKSVTVELDAQGPQADAVVMSWCGVQESKYRADVVLRREPHQHWPALQHQRVYPISEAYMGRPGPRLVEGYDALRRIIESL